MSTLGIVTAFVGAVLGKGNWLGGFLRTVVRSYG
jgi:hypothetical protein